MAGERTRRFTRSLLRPGQAAELRHSAASAAAVAVSSRQQQRQAVQFSSTSVTEYQVNTRHCSDSGESNAMRLEEQVGHLIRCHHKIQTIFLSRAKEKGNKCTVTGFGLK
ncbi:hypothetical protein STEG23_025323 [Scotinomys teguina]